MTALVRRPVRRRARGGALLAPRRRDSRRAAVRDAQLADLASVIARSAHAGMTLPIALADAADALSGPVRDDLAHLLLMTGRGMRLHDALEQWQRRADSDAVDLFATAARLGHSEGGVLAVAMDGVATALVDRAEVEAEARALSAQARASTLVLVALPPFGLAVFSMVDPGVLRTAVGTPLGVFCLATGVALDCLGAVVSLRLVRRALR